MHQPPPLTLNSSIFSGPKENYRQKVVPLKPRISHELANEILENFLAISQRNVNVTMQIKPPKNPIFLCLQKRFVIISHQI